MKRITRKLFVGIFATLMSVQGTFPTAVRAAEEKAYVYHLENPEPVEDSSEEEKKDNLEATEDSQQTPVPTVTPEPSISPEPSPSVEPTPSPTPVPSVEPEVVEEEPADVEQNGPIEISSFEELKYIGTGETYNEITYLPDAQYTITEDIVLPEGEIWTLPDGFTGSIIPTSTSEDRVLYDATNNTIYLYHPFQLAVASSDNRANEPVMDGDAKADTFGMGKLIYPNGEDQPYLTYSTDHQYVISKEFSSEVPELTTAVNTLTLNDSRNCEGRDFPGQVIKEVAGKEFILIGNEEQLRAIGSNDLVYTEIYQAKYVVGYWEDGRWVNVSDWVADTDDNGQPIMLYGGDADLLQGQNGTKDYAFRAADEADGAIGETVGRCGVNQKTGEIDPNMDIDDSGHRYTTDENYIIFRDIDLKNDKWTPLMFSGSMIGVKASSPSDKSTLWNNNDNSIETANSFADVTETGNVQPAHIKNVNVVQEKFNPEDMQGIGFFATLGSNAEINDDVISAGKTSEVKNLYLDSVTVKTLTNELDVDWDLVGGSLALLAPLVGGLVDLLLQILTVGQIDFSFTEVITDLLNVYKEDSSVFSTGAFAGKIIGDTKVDNCHVTNVTVENINSITGGFVGYTEGTTQYSIFAGIGGTLVNVLEEILGIVPGLGLDTLIEVLFENALPLDTLIPTKYISPVLTNCEVSGLNGNVGKDNTNYNGGFAGQVIGTHMIDCHVRNSTYVISTDQFGGGFAGLVRDAEIKGMLQDGLGVTLYDIGRPQSLIMDCSIDGWTPAVVEGGHVISGRSYLGGFAGAMANSYTINDTIALSDASLLSVYGAGSYIGGWTGTGSIGYALDLGSGNQNDTTLLGGVTGLLGSLLASGGNTTALLSLAGISPSAIMGCQINGGTGVNAHAGESYAGGFTGNGNGLYLTKSSSDYLQKLTFWDKESPQYEIPQERNNAISTTINVETGKDCAGGIAGSLGGASVGGLLNDTVGLGQFLGFTVDGISANVGSVTAGGDYAGGAFGMAMAGSIRNTTVNNVSNVSAHNNAGGFIGIGGPGSLADVSGGALTVNLLGLNYLLSLDNLLSVIPGMKLEITDSVVNGNNAFTVSTHKNEDDTFVVEYASGGFIGRSNSTELVRCSVTGLLSVEAPTENGFAGGFVGISRSDDLAEVLDADGDGAVSGELIEIGSLLDAAPVMSPSYTDCTVYYNNANEQNAGVTGEVAGGFVGDFQSGTVDNSTYSSPYVVYDIDYVNGQTYAGGFGGKVYSGALASADGGISLLGDAIKLDLGQLVSVINAYVPIIRNAGVKSDGFTVHATRIASDDSNSSSAGGFAGYVSGAQISNCDVDRLKYTKVTEPDDLEAVVADEYFDDSQSSYAVTGGRYAGGYIGKIDIGSAASVGESLNVLNLVDMSEVLSALNVVTTTIEHSDVYGQAGGYAVRASVENEGLIGHAGGFAGGLYGGHIQDSNAHNFSYIIGQETAGGYVGEMQPGSLASVMDEDTSVLSKIIKIEGGLVSLLETFIPTIRNSSTDSVPCGGVVRANASSTASMQKGVAGGYVGHNEGGLIRGLDTSKWLTSETYDGTVSVCKAERIRSVYGAEFAGGYTGFMEAADMADAGTVNILGELVSVDKILGALQIVYPIQKNTAVYGPLANLTIGEWNSWVEFVGVTGGYGFELAQAGTASDDADLENKLSQYIYGYNVVSGRSSMGEVTQENRGGDAGGYVGLMRSGVLTNSMAYDVKEVKAWHSAGGFAGSMETGGATSLGGVSLLGFDINLENLIDLAQFMVPAIRNSSVYGYKSGMTVLSSGIPDENTSDIGFAGGYVGSAYGAQIQISDDDVPESDDPNWKTESGRYAQPTTSCNVSNLRRVNGTNAIGGYVGLASAASTASVNTHASDGLIQGLLDSLLSNVGELIDLLPVTVTRINKGIVNAADSEWGFVVDGAYSALQDGTTGTVTKYAPYAGGFAGKAEAAFLGYDADSDKKTYAKVHGLRQVDGDLYAGGFIGLGDVNGAAEVGSDEGGSSILDNLLSGLVGKDDVSLVSLDQITAAGILRTYIKDAEVNGVGEGYRVEAHANPEKDSESGGEGTMSSLRYKGVAGGFAGAVLNGTVQDSNATNLSNVKAANYTGGFIGHMGKSGLVDAPGIELLNKLVDLNAGVADLFGTQVENSGVYGIENGIVVEALDGQEPIAGGFAGYADLGRIDDCHVGSEVYSSQDGPVTRVGTEKKPGLNKVISDGIAGGFVGKTDMAYLVSLEANSTLVNALLKVINGLLDLLFVGNLQNLGVIDIDFGDALTVHLLSDGETLGVTLLGLDISAKLIDKSEDGKTGTAVITIGDSEIRLDCTKDTDINSSNLQNVTINLIKGNRTEIDGSTVTGITQGYDVYAGGSGYSDDEEAKKDDLTGSAGGFVGYNHEGKISNSKMELCDVVKGTKEYVGPFTGYNDLRSAYAFNTIKNIEGNNNKYSIYREADSSLTKLEIGNLALTDAVTDTSLDIAYNRYDIGHVTSFEGLTDATQNGVLGMFKALKDAKESSDTPEGATRDLNAYMLDGSKAVLMLDRENPDNPETLVPEPGEMADPCSDKVDITIQKVWDDWFDVGGERPAGITLRIYQHKFTVDEEGNIHETGNPIDGQTSLDCGGSLYSTLTLNEDDKEGFWASTWRTVLEDAPVVEYQYSNNDGVPDTDEDGKAIITAYYVYTVEEEAVSGYTTTYDEWDNMHPLPDENGEYNWDISADDYELTITNKRSIPLPDTGGLGDLMFVLAGVGIVLIGLKRRKRSDAVTDEGY